VTKTYGGSKNILLDGGAGAPASKKRGGEGMRFKLIGPPDFSAIFSFGSTKLMKPPVMGKFNP